MADDYKQCAQCNEVVPKDADTCPHCGHDEFRELTPELLQTISEMKALGNAAWLRLEAGRLIIGSAVSGGLYIFFWLYLTWKQLANETRDRHFPVWHALTWTVPVYQLFRLHRHSAVIQDLAVSAGVPTTLDARTVVMLGAVSFGLGLVSLMAVSPALTTALGIIGIVVTTTIIVWNQGALNAYWAARYGDRLRAAPFEPAEAIIVLFGFLLWGSTLSR